MHGFLHSLQIATLSTWLSVAGFGAVGVWVRPSQMRTATMDLEPATITEISVGDFLLQSTDEQPGPASAAAFTADLVESVNVDPLPAPPELAPLADSVTLPEIPDISPPIKSSREARDVSGSNRPSIMPRSSRQSAGSIRSGAGNSSASTDSGQTSASRLAGGRMPAPVYPAIAKRNGQTGTVVVEFTIGTDGRVISAYAKTPSPWSSLNEAAVNTVRRWKFPPGGVMKIQRPIIFQLR
jgi:TonB family protein